LDPAFWVGLAEKSSRAAFEIKQGLVQFFDRDEMPHPEELLFQDPKEPLIIPLPSGLRPNTGDDLVPRETSSLPGEWPSADPILLGKS
jgi:hypothetical protein